MGILSVIKNDVETLVKLGFDDKYICKSVGMEMKILENIIKHFRNQQKIDIKQTIS